MNKQEAIERARRVNERISSAQAEMIELQKIIEAPEPAGSLLTRPEPASGSSYWTLDGCVDGRMRGLSWKARMSNPDTYEAGGFFQSEKLAEAYAEAIDTMLLLRHQPGSEEAKDAQQIQIEAYMNTGRLDVRTIPRTDRAAKLSKFSPCFVTADDANSALEAVGHERILRMFKTFHHIKD